MAGLEIHDVRGLDVGGAGAEVALRNAVAHVRRGGLIAYPTATVYGFGGRCTEDAVASLARLKRRDQSRPFLILISGIQTVPGLRWTDDARALSSAFWPGALTLVLADPDARFAAGLRGPGGVAVRHTAHPVSAALVEALGEPLSSTSANAPGSPPASDVDGVVAALGALGGEAAEVQIVDAGPLLPSAPSSLVDCSGPAPCLLREGAIPLSRLRRVLPDLKTHV